MFRQDSNLAGACQLKKKNNKKINMGSLHNRSLSAIEFIDQLLPHRPLYCAFGAETFEAENGVKFDRWRAGRRVPMDLRCGVHALRLSGLFCDSFSGATETAAKWHNGLSPSTRHQSWQAGSGQYMKNGTYGLSGLAPTLTGGCKEEVHARYCC